MNKPRQLDPDLELIQQAFGAYEKAGILGVDLLLNNMQKIRNLESEENDALIAELLGEQT